MDRSKIITIEPGNHSGRVLLAVEKYKKGVASLGRAAEVAGLPVGQMMTVLEEFGVQSRIEQEDYRQSLEHLAKVW
jgi:predicted HTH domain antitoxin